MKHAVATLCAWALITTGCSQAQSPVAPLVPTAEAVEMEQGLYDTTERWRGLFGLGGRLTIEEGRRDVRPSYGDGPIELSFKATPTLPGVYTFVFAHLDVFNRPEQIKAIHLYVLQDQYNPHPPKVHPADWQAMWQRPIAPGQEILVQWEASAGGGLSQGWRLSEVIYTVSTEIKQHPGIPRYEYRGGE